MRVDGALDEPMTDISTGDCHSIAYNVNQNTVTARLVGSTSKLSTRIQYTVGRLLEVKGIQTLLEFTNRL